MEIISIDTSKLIDFEPEIHEEYQIITEQLQ